MVRSSSSVIIYYPATAQPCKGQPSAQQELVWIKFRLEWCCGELRGPCQWWHHCCLAVAVVVVVLQYTATTVILNQLLM